MSRSRELTFETSLVIEIAGHNADYGVTVSGTYHPSLPPYYGGEMAPVDPPEPATYEVASCLAKINGKDIDLWPLLTEQQREAVADEGILEAEES